MDAFDKFLTNLPEVKGPEQKKLDFRTKFKWTLTILIAYFLLGVVPLDGLGENALAQFEFLSIILGAEFGSIITLGIGPIVTASIILQLLNGSGIVKFDLHDANGKRRFQGWQKILAYFFIIFEAIIFVAAGGLTPEIGVSPAWLMIQLMIGGLMIMLMDEVVAKWGFGSGLSLFIAAGVSKSLMLALLNPLRQGVFGGSGPPQGALLQVIYHLSPQGGGIQDFGIQIAAIIATIVVFALAVFAMSMKVEIPLSFGRARGFGIRWPLNFMYTSNIPVILIAAVLANIQLGARLLSARGAQWLGEFNEETGEAVSGFVTWLFPNRIPPAIITGDITTIMVVQSLFYITVMMLGAMMFSMFWVKTAGMDSKNLAKQIMNSGLQVPGFRRDPRVMERLLDRYIMPLAVMGGLTVGFIAALADLSGALTSGTGLLLAVMIIYQLYQEIAKQHQMDMHPLMRKFVESN
ncbi:MAG: preprotein translocase subunit SecY [Candidatus Woesearchaeota archaeon]